MPYYTPDENQSVSLFYIDEKPTSPPNREENRPLCLFIHGWACNLRDWTHTIPFLVQRGHRCIAFDHRGHGHSTNPPDAEPEQLRCEVIADDAAALLKHITAKDEGATPRKAIVFGHSSGGLAASLVATRHPELVEALVLIDPVYYFEKAMLSQMYSHLFADPRTFIWSVMNAMSFTQDTPEWLKLQVRVNIAETPEQSISQHAWQKDMVDGACGNWEGAQAEFKSEAGKRACARLVVLGRREKVYEKEQSLGLGEHDEIHVLESGHWLHIQDRKGFGDILGAWLAKIS